MVKFMYGFSLGVVISLLGWAPIVSQKNSEIATLKTELAKKTPVVSRVAIDMENIRKIDFRDVQLIENDRPVRMLCTALRQGSGDKFFLRDAVGHDNVPGNMSVELRPTLK